MNAPTDPLILVLSDFSNIFGGAPASIRKRKWLQRMKFNCGPFFLAADNTGYLRLTWLSAFSVIILLVVG